MTERRVLMVSYHFPPIAGVGVQRTLKHVTYLPEAGWTPSVIAPRARKSMPPGNGFLPVGC